MATHDPAREDVDCSAPHAQTATSHSGTSLFRRFLAYYKPEWKLFLGDTLAAIAIAAIDLAFPILLRRLTGGLFTKGSDAIMGALAYLGLGLAVIYLVRFFCSYFVGAQGHIMGARMETRMRQDLFDQYERLSFSYFDSHSSGDLMSRVVNDLFNIAEAAHHIPEWVITCSIEIVGAFVILFGISPVLAGVMLVITAAFTAVMVWQNIRMQEVFDDSRRKISGVNSQLEDSLSGMRVVKSFANEDLERSKFRGSNERYYRSREKMYKARGVYQATSSLMQGALYTVIVVLGGWLVAQGRLSAADMATFALYISLFTTPIQTLVNSTDMLQEGIAGFARMDEVMGVMPEIQDKSDARELEVTQGAIEFHDVCFAYEHPRAGEEADEGEAGEEEVEKGEQTAPVPDVEPAAPGSVSAAPTAAPRLVIDHMDLAVEPGRTLALVGPSGAGKTTTCSLLMRFYDVDAGSITIDGQDVRDVTQESLHHAIGLVQQDVYLFDGTIAENIEYGRPGATRAEVEDAARKANIHEFIVGLPEGYDTLVGERGSHLSGGQRQRIAIARVFLKDPQILILDEATSSLDNESEEAVQESLAQLSEGRTTLIIAHRLSTIRNADEIATIEHGRIVERGTHEELLARGGTYARYYEMQFAQGGAADAQGGAADAR